MGRYAEEVHAFLRPGDAPPRLPAGTGWVVLSHGGLSAQQARALCPGAPRVLVLGLDAEGEPADGVAWARIEASPRPQLSPRAVAALGAGYGGVVLLDGMREVSGRLLLELAGAGVRVAAWRDGHGWSVRDTRLLALGKPLYRAWVTTLAGGPVAWARRRVQRARAHEALARRNRLAFLGEDEWRAHAARVGVRPAPPVVDGRLRIVHCIGRLNSGGAERQLVNLARAQKRAGHDVRVLTNYPLVGDDAHYLPLLRDEGVPASIAGQEALPAAVDALRRLGLQAEVLGALPEPLRSPVLDLAGELLADPPHVLHCWLDQPNITGAAAGVLVGAPHVLLSTRNLNPTHFPQFYRPWMDVWYRFLCSFPQVRLLANSAPGAEDYARWLGLPREALTVVRNGVDFGHLHAPTGAEVDAVRAEAGAPRGAPLVAGVFRLAQEKQPLLFLEVVARARVRLPGLRVVLAGIGPLAPDVRRRIGSLGLAGCVRLLGRRRDVAAILAAADATLLTSKVEGTPNVLLEAQWLGCPPVATRVGGTPDAVEHGVTGLLCDPADVAGLADALVALLSDPARRAAMGAAGRAFVRERFGLARAAAETAALYAERLGLPLGSLRIAEAGPGEPPVPPAAVAAAGVARAPVPAAAAPRERGAAG